ncbi:pyridoxamine 5'-phosphate oxidase family protein [Rhizobium halophilum]|uniref:pyridoxamine 5'-phosphate oxidase family protein n=1 Tax=Rhizobium halophilum TaxID=2846852 RepID=UPI001EFC80C2|nr:pyridoxamine 5'-phosphate oxidase family protein [Rhizobium halophilum]MCF6367469.1 pyridoxamine 5'-phosphate oxidase family protein [Rhizobium halophilum]
MAGPKVHLDPDIADFIQGEVMIILGTCSRGKLPDIGRGVGCRVLAPGNTVEVLVSAWQWPETVANLRDTGEVAVTFVRVADYRAYQIKGRATLRDCTPQHYSLCNRYIAAATAALVDQGVPTAMTEMWLMPRDLVVAHFGIRSLSIKTPGADAGTLVGERR